MKIIIMLRYIETFIIIRVQTDLTYFMFKLYFLLGVIFIILGLILIAFPFLSKLLPTIEKIPSIIVYVYKKGNFSFVTSPILIIISITSILWYIISQHR